MKMFHRQIAQGLQKLAVAGQVIARQAWSELLSALGIP